ncbi:MAG: hypothetical protein ACTSUE_17810 [Promethearchaeota archaeon]
MLGNEKHGPSLAGAQQTVKNHRVSSIVNHQSRMPVFPVISRISACQSRAYEYWMQDGRKG